MYLVNGVTCMEQSTRRRQGRAVTALFPSPPKNIAVSQPQTTTILTFNLTFVKCPCSVFNAKCHYNLYFFNNNNNNWRPCLPSGFGTCVEQPAIVCQECIVADDVPSRAEKYTFTVVV